MSRTDSSLSLRMTNRKQTKNHHFFVKTPQIQLSDRAKRWDILAYFPLLSDEERKQVWCFHEKKTRFFVKSGIMQRATNIGRTGCT